jgi:hypothetical protein
MRILAALIGCLFLVIAFFMLVTAKSALHEAVSGVVFLIGVVIISAAAICSYLSRILDALRAAKQPADVPVLQDPVKT